jgi:hypothetical protein
MSEAQPNDRSQPARDRTEEDREFDREQGAQGAPNGAPRDRGSRQDNPAADTIMPGREFGAGGQIDDGPDETAGAGGD